eukprot:1161027-Pelagomonas_calceolata.AAC.2
MVTVAVIMTFMINILRSCTASWHERLWHTTCKAPPWHRPFIMTGNNMPMHHLLRSREGNLVVGLLLVRGVGFLHQLF